VAQEARLQAHYLPGHSYVGNSRLAAAQGYYLRALKLKNVHRELAEEHYVDLKSKPFYPGLVEYIIRRELQGVQAALAVPASTLSLLTARCVRSGPVVAMVWEGKQSVVTGRKIVGATNPLQSEPGTVRGDFCIDVGRNLIHGALPPGHACSPVAAYTAWGRHTLI